MKKQDHPTVTSAHDLRADAAGRPARRHRLSDRWWRQFRTAGHAEVFHVDLSPQAARERTAFAWLDGEEQARWSRSRLDRPRREFVDGLTQQLVLEPTLHARH